eukprot:TRINITY_DN612_c0_g1_i3.p1 TRINITY_DN612_c0_g1~~TRINITY_DN612_c0_g1_i3.p1  ORF type:complete len:348 (-),score=41.01 TRINITY_DN612_c0_g1_i3:31-1074(-)
MPRSSSFFALAYMTSFGVLTGGVSIRNTHTRFQSDEAFLSICSKDVRHHCCTDNEMVDKINSSFLKRPIVVFSSGCAGSSALLDMMQDIAEFSNHPVLDCDGGYEILADISDGFYGEENLNMTRALREFIWRANSTNRRLLFKAEQRLAETDPALMPYLRSLGSFVVDFDRDNKLDVALCAVRDCFDNFMKTPIGERVTQGGKPASGCTFRGRGSNETSTDIQVKVNTDYLLDNLRSLDKNHEWAGDYLRHSGMEHRVKVVYEDLFRHILGGTRNLLLSVDAWQRLMSKVGVETPTVALLEYLVNQTAQDKAPQPHTSTISNFDEVKRVLETCSESGCERLKGMLRE